MNTGGNTNLNDPLYAVSASSSQGAAVTAIGFDKEVNSADLPFALFVVGIGLFGALMSEKYYELFRLHGKTAEHLLKAISDQIPAPEIMTIKPAADKEHRLKFPKISRMRLHHLWVYLHIFVALIGCCLVWKTFPKSPATPNQGGAANPSQPIRHDTSNVIGGWLPSLTFALGGVISLDAKTKFIELC